MQFKCETCGKEFGSEEAFTQHNSDKHGIGKKSVAKESAQEKKSKKENEIGKSLRAKKTRKIIKYTAVILLAVAVAYFAMASIPANPASQLREGLGAVGSTHVHSDIKVYLEGSAVDFSLAKYQVNPTRRHVHMEDRDGDVIHIHATGVKTGFFLDSIGIKFNSTCLVMDTGAKFCGSGNKTLKFYVNGEPNDELEMHVMKSTDRMLISYGDETDLASQLDSVTSKGAKIDKGVTS